MVDPFINKVAQVAGRTSARLQALAADLREKGLDSQAKSLENLAAEQRQIYLDCITDTQPI